METEDKLRRSVKEQQRLADKAFVSLAVASTLTYLYVTERSTESEFRVPLEVLPLVAVALAQVAPIHKMDDDKTPLTVSEINALLMGPLRSSKGPSLDQFKMRRGVLRRAMETLKQARATFGPTL